jgi:cyclic beta-1,2-glucan synthetase
MTGPATVRLARWAERLYRESVAAPPLGVELLAMEQLEAHARSLAREHALGPLKNDHRLMRRLADSERVIARCHELLMVAHAAGCALSPAAEWLLDNHGLVEEQIALARQHFPRGYSRRLPRLAGGEMAGQPRVYDLIRQFVARVDGRVDAEALGLYTAAYQSVTDLDLGELWSVAIMLRLSLIENLRRVAVSLAWQRVHRDAALAWARRIDAPADRHESTVLVLAEMVRENLPLSPAFVAEFSRALQGRGATTTFVLAWLEQRLAERGHRIEAVVRAEGQMQAANQAAMANSIASLRLVNGLAWHVFVETHSRVERILRAEPAGVYAHMDFATRDTYRHVVEGLSRRLSLEEAAVATPTWAMSWWTRAGRPSNARCAPCRRWCRRSSRPRSSGGDSGWPPISCRWPRSRRSVCTCSIALPGRRPWSGAWRSPSRPCWPRRRPRWPWSTGCRRS